MRFGDFTLLEELGSSPVADNYRALHATQGGPYFLKLYRRLPPRMHPDFLARCDRLITINVAGVVRHLGHGVLDCPYAVQPLLVGAGLADIGAALRERRVAVGLDTCLVVALDVLDALARWQAALDQDSNQEAKVRHGLLSWEHVRVLADGSVTITGISTPRGSQPRAEPEARFDVAGATTVVYELLGPGGHSHGLPTAMDRVLRRGLGIGPVAEQVSAAKLASLLRDTAAAADLPLSRSVWLSLVDRALRDVERKSLEQGKRVLHDGSSRTAADSLPELQPLPQPPPLASLGLAAPPPRTAWRPPPTPVPALVPAPLVISPPTLPPLRPSSVESKGAFTAAATLPSLPTLPASSWAEPGRPGGLPTMADRLPGILPAVVPAPAAPTPAPTPLAPRPAQVRSPPTVVAVAAPPPNTDLFAEDTRETELPQLAREVNARRDRAIQVLLEGNHISRAAFDGAVEDHHKRGGRLLEILVQQNIIGENELAVVLSRAAGCARAGAGLRSDERAVRRLPRTYLLARRLLPLASPDPSALVVAVVDPFDVAVVEELRVLLQRSHVTITVASRADIVQGIQSAYAAEPGDEAMRVVLGTSDDAKVQQLGARLATEGMAVEHVINGATLKDIVIRRPPAAVLCDANLPGIDALTLLLWLRNDTAHSELPFFVLGARSDEAMMQRALDLGADDYVGEPLRLDPLVARLRRVMGRRVSQPSQPPVATVANVPRLGSPLPNKKSASPGLFDFNDLPDLDDGPHDGFPPAMQEDDVDVPSMPTGVMGTLRQMALPEIVQSLEMGRKTARVDIVPTDGEKGTIAFEQGSLRYADYGSLLGEAAFYKMMRHTEGFFRIHYGDAPKSVNIHQPTTYLLLEAMRLMDEEAPR